VGDGVLVSDMTHADSFVLGEAGAAMQPAP
jgi:hypothetical protein